MLDEGPGATDHPGKIDNYKKNRLKTWAIVYSPSIFLKYAYNQDIYILKKIILANLKYFKLLQPQLFTVVRITLMAAIFRNFRKTLIDF